MKVKNIAAAVGIIPLAIGLATLNAPQPVPSTASLVATSRKANAPKPTCVSELSDCPLEGCGGDAELNEGKNRTDKPTPGEVEEWKLSEIVGLNEESPTSWSSKNSRSTLQELGEGTPIVIKGWLINAHVTGAVETCNCKLKGQANNDFHLNLVARKTDPMKESVVVELSPRTRLAGWTIAKLRSLGDLDAELVTYVRVTGWLMFDSQHASFEHMPRATAWEVHPVTKFEVCTVSKAKCEQGTGWKLLEEVQ
jgi:hypothetical protein